MTSYEVKQLIAQSSRCSCWQEHAEGYHCPCTCHRCKEADDAVEILRARGFRVIEYIENGAYNAK